MKKNLWILLAISALIAMFVISGCQKPVTPTPTPTPTPTAKPTPTPDANCPKVVSTEVFTTWDPNYNDCVNWQCSSCPEWDWSDPCWECIECVEEECLTPCYIDLYSNCYCTAYDDPDCGPVPTGTESTGTFKIVITFDENIDPLESPCVFNPANWEVKVKNNERIITELIPTIYDIEIDGKQIIVSAAVHEAGYNEVFNPVLGDFVDIYYIFCGLICNPDNVTSYEKTVNGPWYGYSVLGYKAAPTIADEITWKLGGNCVVADELGNYCCGFEGKDCCVEPVCETCEPCPIEGSICQ